MSHSLTQPHRYLLLFTVGRTRTSFCCWLGFWCWLVGWSKTVAVNINHIIKYIYIEGKKREGRRTEFSPQQNQKSEEEEEKKELVITFRGVYYSLYFIHSNSRDKICDKNWKKLDDEEERKENPDSDHFRRRQKTERSHFFIIFLFVRMCSIVLPPTIEIRNWTHHMTILWFIIRGGTQ